MVSKYDEAKTICLKWVITMILGPMGVAAIVQNIKNAPGTAI